ncbi:MAG: hypothetical protein ACE5IG_03765 [Dehalococcoidia bacterium]
MPFPLGFALGKPNDPEFQHRVVSAALDLLQCDAGPVLAEFPEEVGPNELPQSSTVHPSPASEERDAADEVTALRAFYERWVADHGGRTAVGLSGIPQRRFRGMIRFMEAYAQGEEVDIRDRPDDVSVHQFIRYCVDDLKAFYYEARMAQRSNASEPQLHRWFWGETAAGCLVSAIADCMKATDDPELKHIAFGIAR